MSAVIEIEATHCTSSGARYRVWHEGSVLLESTKDPEHASARALQRMGINGRLQVKRVGKTQIDFESLIAVCAARCVAEGENSGPRFAKYVERDFADDAS